MNLRAQWRDTVGLFSLIPRSRGRSRTRLRRPRQVGRTLAHTRRTWLLFVLS